VALIIDGYNLIHAIGLPQGSEGPNQLRRARTDLLGLLCATLEPAELRSAIVVFDSSLTLPHLPRQLNYRGIDVRFSSEHASADELIEELIRQQTAPRRLTVVSSDHRVQQAARRRRAATIDSEAWYETLQARRAARHREPLHDAPETPDKSATAEDEDVDYWLKTFDDEASEAKPEADSLGPFPPGYADDLGE
jgi:predicted RNA-binding protein with PIN domain